MIFNVDVGSEFKKVQGSEDILYQTFDNMASHFGRDMKLHRHDGFYQLFFLQHGKINIMLERDKYEEVGAPMFILFPPSMPHAFHTRPDTHGHVLTVSRTVIDPLLMLLHHKNTDMYRLNTNFYGLGDSKVEFDTMSSYFDLIAKEACAENQGKNEVLNCLVRALFVFIFRFVEESSQTLSSTVKGDMRLFIRFNALIDTNFSRHWTVDMYAKHLGISVTKLKDLCRQHIRKSPKSIIFEKIITEAKNLLKFTDYSVSEISYQLGFKDPAYFARFFTRLADVSPSRWRQQNVLITYIER